MKQRKISGVKKVIFSIAIALIMVFFIVYAINSVYPLPEYMDYCGEDISKPTIQVDTKEKCESVGGSWNEWQVQDKTNQNITGWCDLYSKCNKEFNDVKRPYELNLFILNLVFGLLILIGAFFISIEAISTGFMGGGAILMVYGTLRYWGELSNVLRTLFLGIALGVLVYFGYKKLND